MSVSIPQTPAGVNALLDHMKELGSMKNDAALCRALEVAPPVISKLRHGTLPLGAVILLRIHDVFEMPIRDAKAILLTGLRPTSG